MSDFDEDFDVLKSTDDFHTYNDQGLFDEGWDADTFDTEGLQGPWEADPFGPDYEVWDSLEA